MDFKTINIIMKRKKLYLALVLLLVGLIGMASILTMEIPMPQEILDTLGDKFSPFQIKLLVLINPIILLIIAITIGTLLYQSVGLRVPLVERLVGISVQYNARTILLSGVVGGLIAGAGISIIAIVFKSITPHEFSELSKSYQPTLAARFLYGGIVEELFMRFGLMTFFVWLCSKITKSTRDYVYWVGILLATLIFAIGHFPVVFNSVESPSITLLTYVILGNSVGGIIFGWLYWKKGLESAIVAHAFAHVVMILAKV
jgi:hypothetical protein